MGSVLFRIFVTPLELVMESVFTVILDIIGSPGYTIIAMSIFVNFLILPLYLRSDALQEEEAHKQKQMEHWVTHIRKTFKGEERSMMLAEYYRQNDYHPGSALKGSLSLFLQIPFFLAAYHFLSNLALLRGTSFLTIANLGEPDTMLTVLGTGIHVLPVLMTIINLLSGAVYAGGLPAKSRVQIFVLAVVFLAVLYNSPSGLVLYWTMNNLFSLCKNLFMKYVKNKPLGLSLIFAVIGSAFFFMMFVRGKFYTAQILGFSLAVLILCFIPLVCYICARAGVFQTVTKAVAFLPANTTDGKTEQGVRPPSTLDASFFCLAALALLLGLVIPLSVLSSSPVDFINEGVNPYLLAADTFWVFLGTFGVWFAVIWRMQKDRGRVIFKWLVLTLLLGAVLSHFFFGKDMGILYTTAIYEQKRSLTVEEIALNAVLWLAAAVISALLARKKTAVYMAAILAAGFAVIGVYYFADMRKSLAADPPSSTQEAGELPEITLSRNGRNVVVIMLDRAISGYVPYILGEDASLKESFDGFTYYPDTISFAGNTKLGSPAIFGGYGYTPAAINERADELLVDKHNEALKLLPLILGEAGFETEIANPPYPNYSQGMDGSVFEEYPFVKPLDFENCLDITHRDWSVALNERTSVIRKRNFAGYSVMRSSPLFMWDRIYDGGSYLSTEQFNDINPPLANFYAGFEAIVDQTRFRETGDCLFIADSNITHAPQELQLPDYSYAIEPDNAQWRQDWLDGVDENIHMDNKASVGHYHVNAAAFRILGRWFDLLRAEGVYDNTRIILVSDHGFALGQFDKMLHSDGVDVQRFNPLLMCKDFDAKGFTVSDAFMTTADVPTIALDGIVQDPVNPFTDEPVNSSAKEEGVLVTTSGNFAVSKSDGNLFDVSDGVWYRVSGNIFDEASWERVE